MKHGSSSPDANVPGWAEQALLICEVRSGGFTARLERDETMCIDNCYADWSHRQRHR